MNNHELLELVAPDDNSVESVPLSNEQLESILTIQQVALRAIADDKPESEILDKLCILAEGVLGNSVASIMRLHKDERKLSVISAPSMCKERQKNLCNLRTDIGFGSCTSAIFYGEPAYIRDTFSDPRAAKVVDMFRELNIRSCWSVPIYDRNNLIVGSLSLSSFKHRVPTTYHDRLMKTCSSIVSILLERKSLRKLSMTDKLTGLWNREKLDTQLLMNKAAFSRYSETYCVLILDVDHFKSVNDTYGHNVGDAVLVELAKVLKQSIRLDDVVGRWGGEEFMVILSKSESAQAKIVAQKIRLTVKHHDFPSVGEVTVSLGVFEVNQELSVLEVVGYADQALYKAKKNGRNRVAVFTPDMVNKSDLKKTVVDKRLLPEAAH